MSGTSSDFDLLLLGDAHAHEEARLQHDVLVLEHGAAGQRAGAGIDLRCDVVERAGVRIALLGLQADIDGDRPESFRVTPAMRISRGSTAPAARRC